MVWFWARCVRFRRTRRPSLESELLDADCGHHVHLRSRISEQPWAAGPLEWGFEYPQELVATIAPLLLNESGIAHMCEERGNIVRVTIPRIGDSGFDITVEATTVGVLVHTGTLFHAYLPFSWNYDHWDYDDEDEEFSGSSDPYRWREPAEQALGLVTRSFEPGRTDSGAASRRDSLLCGSGDACARPVATTSIGDVAPLSLLGET